MIKSRTLANDILKQTELPDVSGKAIQEAEAKAEFLIKELNYNEQVRQALLGVRDIKQVLDHVEQASDERRILDALHLLESKQGSAHLRKDIANCLARVVDEAGCHANRQILPGHETTRHSRIRAKV